MYVYKHKILSNISMNFYFPEVLMMNNIQQWTVRITEHNYISDTGVCV